MHLPGAYLRPMNSRYLHVGPHTKVHELVTDASGHLGHAFATDKGVFQATWTMTQRDWAIHVKELYVILNAVRMQLDRYAGSQVLAWTDNQSVLYTINKPKAHASNRDVLLQLFHIAATYDITIKAVYIPSKLNTTADLLSRHVFAALASDYAIVRDIFVTVGGFRCNTVAFADPKGRTAHYLLGGKATSQPVRYFSSVRSVFLNTPLLTGCAIWFNPPFSLLE